MDLQVEKISKMQDSLLNEEIAGWEKQLLLHEIRLKEEQSIISTIKQHLKSLQKQQQEVRKVSDLKKKQLQILKTDPDVKERLNPSKNMSSPVKKKLSKPTVVVKSKSQITTKNSKLQTLQRVVSHKRPAPEIPKLQGKTTNVISKIAVNENVKNSIKKDITNNAPMQPTKIPTPSNRQSNVLKTKTKDNVNTPVNFEKSISPLSTQQNVPKNKIISITTRRSTPPSTYKLPSSPESLDVDNHVSQQIKQKSHTPIVKVREYSTSSHSFKSRIL